MNKVSIIIANYNYGNFLTECLDSAFWQTHQCHVGIIDDGSNDNSHDVIMDYINNLGQATNYHKDKNIICNANFTYMWGDNQGASVARNTLIKKLWDRSDFFSILDSDDVYFPNKVEKHLKEMQDKNVGVVYSDYITSYPSGLLKYEYKESYSPSALNYRCIVSSGALIRKSYLEQVLLDNQDVYDVRLHGPASKGFIGCTEDYDLWLRMSKVCIMKHIPEALSIYRIHNNNQSLKMNQEIFHKNAEILRQR